MTAPLVRGMTQLQPEAAVNPTNPPAADPVGETATVWEVMTNESYAQ